MATLPTRELKIGTIIEKTLAVAERSGRAVAIYVLAISAITIAITWYTADMIQPTQQAVIGLVKALIGVIAAYVLLEAMLRATGLRQREGEAVFFSYLGLSILYTLGVGLGFILLIIPGLLVMARWSIAQPMLVARGDGVMKSLGESWELTRGHEFSIIVAALAMLILFIVVTIACSVMFEPDNLVGIVVAQLASSVMGVISLAMGVALYGLITISRDVAQTFQ